MEKSQTASKIEEFERLHPLQAENERLKQKCIDKMTETIKIQKELSDLTDDYLKLIDDSKEKEFQLRSLLDRMAEALKNYNGEAKHDYARLSKEEMDLLTEYQKLKG